jgi:hypothetical protein
MNLSSNLKQRFIVLSIVSCVIGCLGMASTNAQVVTVKSGKTNKAAKNADNASDKLMQEANKRLTIAERHLKSALPIYEGHRNNAIDLTNIAEGEIKIGLIYDRLHERGGNQFAGAKKPANKMQPDGKRDARYTPEQVKRSNANLMEAGKLLEDALALMRRAEPDYGGHRASAINNAEKAIEQLKIAL